MKNSVIQVIGKKYTDSDEEFIYENKYDSFSECNISMSCGSFGLREHMLLAYRDYLRKVQKNV